MNKTATHFERWFGIEFGAPFPVSLDSELKPLTAWLWASSAATQILTTSGLPFNEGFMPEKWRAPEYPDFTLAGCWGHGANSYAFYFIQKKGATCTFLRLPYGGVYMNAERSRNAVVAELVRYEECYRSVTTTKPAAFFSANMDCFKII